MRPIVFRDPVEISIQLHSRHHLGNGSCGRYPNTERKVQLVVIQNVQRLHPKVDSGPETVLNRARPVYAPVPGHTLTLESRKSNVQAKPLPGKGN